MVWYTNEEFEYLTQMAGFHEHTGSRLMLRWILQSCRLWPEEGRTILSTVNNPVIIQLIARCMSIHTVRTLQKCRITQNEVSSELFVKNACLHFGN